MATSEATAGQTPDQYGQLHPVETPELISRKQKEFEEELKKLSEKELASVKQAEEKCPELLTDAFKLQFLRCEIFNADLAAKRYARYWDKRIEICGPEKAFMPLTLDKALKDDWTALTMGFAQVIPGVKDPMGRSICFINPANQDRTKYERKSMARAVWYMVHAALENDESQKHGVLFLAYGRDAKFGQFDRELAKLNMTSLQGAIPVRLPAFHMCRPPAFFKILFAIMKLFMSENTSKRMKPHYGTKEEVVEALKGYGLEKDVLPKKIGGDVELDVVAWLEKRKSEGR